MLRLATPRAHGLLLLFAALAEPSLSPAECMIHDGQPMGCTREDLARLQAAPNQSGQVNALAAPSAGSPPGRGAPDPNSWGRFAPNPPYLGPDGQPLPPNTPLTPELVEQMMQRLAQDRPELAPRLPVIRSILLGSIDASDSGMRPGTLGDANLYSSFYMERRLQAEALQRQIDQLKAAGRPIPPDLVQQFQEATRRLERVMRDGRLANSDIHTEIMRQDSFSKQVMTGQSWNSSEPRNPVANVTYGNDLLQKGDPKAAIAMANQALANGGGSGALSLRAAANSQLGNYGDAVSDARNALDLDPSNKQALAALKLSEGRGDNPGGGTAGAAVPPAGAGGGAGYGGSPSFGRGFMGGGSASYGQFSFGGAARSPGAAAAARFNEQGRDALRMGDSAKALDYASRSLQSDPKNPGAFFMMAKAYALMGKWKEAAEAAAKGLAVDPKDKLLLEVSARALLNAKDYKGAAAAANRALELDPRAAWALAARGYAQGGLGDRAAALADLNSAAALDPAFKSAYDAALRTPQEEDLAFLFPGDPAAGAKGAMGAAGRGRSFGVVTGAASVGGLLLALGLLSAVAKPLSEGVSSVFTKLTRRGPSLAAPPPQEPAPSGLLQGKYELGRQIGAGGMGLVFEGTDRSLNRRVAVKRMRDEIRLDPRERARFVAEAKTVAALHHPNIVDIYAVVEEVDELHLVFEYVEGRTLHELLSAGRIAPADAAKLVRGAADALDFAHSRGVIHRDMKPSNLMVDGAGRLKVMDFGIARAAKDAMTRGPAAMTNTIVGTPPYMAPEQEQGQVRKESDVYALAVCAYELLCGRLPFPGVGAGMLMNKINMSYVPPSKLAEHLPAALDEIFKKAFQPDPEQRYRGAGEFAAALEAALSAPVKA